MKKSKIIVPALGIIALSTAASITGTVAWFTASKSATITAGEFAVTKTTNNLKVTLTSGVGTTANDETKAVSFKDNYLLTDASFDHSTKTVYNPNGEGTAIASSFPLSEAVDSGTVTKNVRSTEGGKTVLSVATWNMAVTVSFGSVAGDMGLYLTKNSVVTLADGTVTPLYTAKGFRVAFVPKTDADATAGAVSRVWADLQSAANCKHVDHLTSADPASPTEAQKAITGVPYEQWDTGTYKYKDLVDSSHAPDLPADSGINATDAAKRPDYLGKIAYTANTEQTINFTVVVWYEGTDPEIKNRSDAAEYQTVKASIELETVKLAAA